MKPEAPAEYRGLWKPIRTNVPGIEITELFPRQAKVADKFSIVRSLHHDTGDHFAGGHIMLTSRPGRAAPTSAGKYPSIGSIAAKTLGPRQPGMPAYVAVPYAASIGLRPGYFGANYLGVEHNPFETDGDPNSANFKVQNLNLPDDLSIDRLEDRQTLFQRLRPPAARRRLARARSRPWTAFSTMPMSWCRSDAARKAFDISAEDPRTARPLRPPLAGARARCWPGGWSKPAPRSSPSTSAAGTITGTCKSGMENYLPHVDSGCRRLFAGSERPRPAGQRRWSMLCGEFSRTPRMNNGGNGGPPLSMGTPGRDHWGNAMFCLMGGGGIRGGQIVGSTNRLGEVPKDRPLTAGDIHATIYHVLGIDPSTSFLNHSGRPVPAIDRGEVIQRTGLNGSDEEFRYLSSGESSRSSPQPILRACTSSLASLVVATTM